MVGADALPSDMVGSVSTGACFNSQSVLQQAVGFIGFVRAQYGGLRWGGDVTSFDWIWKFSKLQSGKWNGRQVPGPTAASMCVRLRKETHSALFLFDGSAKYVSDVFCLCFKPRLGKNVGVEPFHQSRVYDLTFLI